MPYPTQGRFQKDESSQPARAETRQQKWSMPCLALLSRSVMLEKQHANLGNPSSEARSKTSCGVTPQQSSESGKVLWPLLRGLPLAGGGGPGALARFAAARSLTARSLTLAFQTTTLSLRQATPFASQPESQRRQISQIETWDRIAPGVLFVGPCTGLAAPTA